MSYISDKITEIQSTLRQGVTLLAVSKFHPAEKIQQAYDAGHRSFGESRPQELKAKYDALPKDIKWHMIGHLQTNKIKYIAPFVHLIESLDSERLAAAIDREAAKCGRTIDCLLERVNRVGCGQSLRLLSSRADSSTSPTSEYAELWAWQPLPMMRVWCVAILSDWQRVRPSLLHILGRSLIPSQWVCRMIISWQWSTVRLRCVSARPYLARGNIS